MRPTHSIHAHSQALSLTIFPVAPQDVSPLVQVARGGRASETQVIIVIMIIIIMIMMMMWDVGEDES